MELKDILAISGKPGLYQNVGQAKNGVIVESLIDGKRFPAFAHERISSLAEISVFTTSEDVELNKVFKKIFEKYEGKEAIDPKSGSDELKTFMGEILPDYDEERVYTSDIKKMVAWYNLLVSKDLLEFPEEEPETTEESESEEKPETETSQDEEPETETTQEEEVSTKTDEKTAEDTASEAEKS